MKKIIWYWNAMYYCVYLLFNNVFLWINYLNPVVYFTKISRVKKFYQQRGINDMQEFTQSVASDPKRGFNVWKAGSLMIGITMALLFGICNCSQSLSNVSFSWFFENGKREALFIFSLIVPSVLFNYFTLLVDNKYLDFFQEFSRWTATKRRIYCLISYLFILIILGFFIFSLRFMKFS